MSAKPLVKKLVAAGTVGLTVALTAATPALATDAGISGSLTKNQTTWYGTQRTITANGSNIYVKKTDGPEIDVKWYKCSDRNNAGGWVRLPNADPTGRLLIGSGFAAGTVFCLAAISRGSNATDSWSGTVSWNVFS
ncbi:MAG TPA: hypothetical protein VN408_19580 [Actinoplanes sp.]|nr:hypothetical protein [Actinoplanes sp.]